MNINELKAGEELDRLIAEKIFGWNKGKNFHHVEGWTWINETNEPAHSSTWDGHWIRSFSDTPEYSSSIKDAWLVFEKMKDFECPEDKAAAFGIVFCMNQWRCGYFWHDMEYLTCKEETAPLAICKAALRAIYIK